MEFNKEDLEAMSVKKSDFDSFRTQLTEEIENVKEICKDRNKRQEIFIKQIDEDLTNLRIESTEARAELRSEMAFLKGKIEMVEAEVKDYGSNLVKLWHIEIDYKAESNESFSKLGFWIKINAAATMIIILMMFFSKRL